MDHRINPTNLFFPLILETELKENEMAPSKGRNSGVIHSTTLMQLQSTSWLLFL